MLKGNYRNTERRAEYLPLTREIANWGSIHSHGRQYKYSVTQQLLGAISGEFSEMFNALKRQKDNRFPQSFRQDTLDVIYYTEKPEVVPQLFYTDENNTRTEITPSPFANHESWWYDTVPTGINYIKTITPAADLIFRQPLQKKFELGQLFTSPVTLHIALEGDEANFINNIYGQGQFNTQIILTGLDDQDVVRREFIDFLYPTSEKSRILWKKLNSVETVYFDDPSKFKLSVTPFYAEEKKEDKFVRLETTDGISKPVFWTWDSDNSRLVQQEFAAKNVTDYHAGIRDLNDVYSYKLLAIDEDYQEPVELQTIASFIPGEKDNNIYVIHDSTLIAYSKFDPYPGVLQKATELRTNDPVVRLDVTVEDGIIKAKGIYPRIKMGKYITGYRFLIMKSNGDTLYCDNVLTGNEVNADWTAFDNQWTNYGLINTLGFYSPQVQYGTGVHFTEDLIVRLDIRLRDGSVETDTFVVDKQVKLPLFQLALKNDYQNAGLSYSADGFLCLNTETAHTKILFRNDTYLIDENTGRLIFAEKYNEVEGLSKPIVTFNVLNELDQYGAVHSLERFTGEKNYDYIHRLRFAFHNKFNASKNGLINAIATELNLGVKDFLYVKRDSFYKLSFKFPYLILSFGADSSKTNIIELEDLAALRDWFTGNGFTVTVLDESILSLPARCIVPFVNYKYYDDMAFAGLKRIPFNLNPDEKIIPTSVTAEGFDYVNNVGLFTAGKKQFTVSGNTILANSELTYDNKISFTTFTDPLIIKASPVIVSSLYEIQNFGFGYNYINKITQEVIQYTENLFPTKWNK